MGGRGRTRSDRRALARRRVLVLFDGGGRGRPRSDRRAFVCYGMGLLFNSSRSEWRCKRNNPMRGHQAYFFLSKVYVWIDQQLRRAAVKRNHDLGPHFNALVAFTPLLFSQMMPELQDEFWLRRHLHKLMRF